MRREPRGPGAGRRSAPSRPAGPGAIGAFLAKLGWRSLFLAPGLPLGPPNFVPVPPPARALQGGPGAGPGTVREDLFSSYCDYAIYSLKKGKQNKTCPSR